MDLFQLFIRHTQRLLPRADYRQRVLPYESFYSFVKTLTVEYTIHKQGYSKEKAERIFQFVRENNYDLFKRFYEIRYNLIS